MEHHLKNVRNILAACPKEKTSSMPLDHEKMSVLSKCVENDEDFKRVVNLVGVSIVEVTINRIDTNF